MLPKFNDVGLLMEFCNATKSAIYFSSSVGPSYNLSSAEGEAVTLTWTKRMHGKLLVRRYYIPSQRPWGLHRRIRVVEQIYHKGCRSNFSRLQKCEIWSNCFKLDSYQNDCHF